MILNKSFETGLMCQGNQFLAILQCSQTADVPVFHGSEFLFLQPLIFQDIPVYFPAGVAASAHCSHSRFFGQLVIV